MQNINGSSFSIFSLNLQIYFSDDVCINMQKPGFIIQTEAALAIEVSWFFLASFFKGIYEPAVCFVFFSSCLLNLANTLLTISFCSQVLMLQIEILTSHRYPCWLIKYAITIFFSGADVCMLVLLFGFGLEEKYNAYTGKRKCVFFLTKSCTFKNETWLLSCFFNCLWPINVTGGSSR